LLDRRRIDEEKTNWQWFNLLTPLAILGLLGGVFYWLKKVDFTENTDFHRIISRNVAKIYSNKKYINASLKKVNVFILSKIFHL
jgi:hypothetical protein